MTFEKAFEEKFDQLLVDLTGESDRARVIIVAAHLDALLEDMLRHALVQCPTSHDSIFDGPNAPLANFSNRIDFSYRLGLISEFASKSLHIVRKIRNAFAHSISGCSFNEASVKARVQELYKLHRIDEKYDLFKEEFDETVKSRFIMSGILLIGIIQEIHHKIGANTPRSPEWPYLQLHKTQELK
jgi:hypothetical protein